MLGLNCGVLLQPTWPDQVNISRPLVLASFPMSSSTTCPVPQSKYTELRHLPQHIYWALQPNEHCKMCDSRSSHHTGTHTAHRGSFVVLEGLCISGGIKIHEWISFGLYFATRNSANWRVPIVFPVNLQFSSSCFYFLCRNPSP